MTGDRDDELNKLASAQFGAFSRLQAKELKLDRFALRRREQRGTISAATGNVFVFDASADTFERRATIGLLEAGTTSAISSTTGAALYDIRGFDLEPIHIVRSHAGSRAQVEGIVWHFTRFLPDHHLGLLDNGLRLATPPRVFADLAATKGVHAKRAERAVDSAMAARLLNRRLLSEMADEWCERGRLGSAFLHAYLRARPADWVPPASNVQRRFVEIMKAAGFPEPRVEVNLGDAHHWLGRVDCLDPELPLVAEIDSDRFHLAPLDAAADQQRDDDMEAAGFVVVRFTENEVWYERDTVIRRWRAKRDEVRRQHPRPATGA
jgi:hypothetical protein